MKLLPEEPTQEMLDAVDSFMQPVDRALYERMYQAAPEVEQHPDDIAIDAFANAMKAKMKASRDKGRKGWDDKTQCPDGRLQQMLIEHLAKGDPVDVGNFAMMLFNRGEMTAPDVEQEPVAFIGESPENQTRLTKYKDIAESWGFSYKSLYTHPQPKREPLSAYMIIDFLRKNESFDEVFDDGTAVKFARAIEKAHGIGTTL